jgi:predicted AlkP superfamily pyrophosphatase or phosphodiesterase
MSRKKQMINRILPTTIFASAAKVASATSLLTLCLAPLALAATPTPSDIKRVEHVLLISVDGLHNSDLTQYVKLHPTSTLAALSQHGMTYSSAFTPVPSDSFPGLTALLSGATPKTTGIFYDVSYDRNLAAPGSDCSAKGTEVTYDESLDINSDKLDGGGGIDIAKLPRDPAHGCAPVYPHQFSRVNNIFEIIKQHSGQTAWADKHFAYDLVQGSSGKGVDDLYTPEIDSNIEDKSDGITSSIDATEKYDDLKVAAVINEIDGQDHSGSRQSTVPTLFGLNFQAVSVGQKLEGYSDAKATPTAGLQQALDHTDASLKKIVDALAAAHLADSTAIILTAKHGQSPIDPTQRRIVDKKLIPALVDTVQPKLLAAISQDDVALLWLTDHKQAAAVAAVLLKNKDKAGIKTIWQGSALAKRFGDPTKDSRTPDLIVEAQPGVIYTKTSATKKAEHGGFAEDDRHVALLIALPGIKSQTIRTAVATTQVAPTILKVLGLPIGDLQGAKIEHVAVLPGLARAGM